MNRWNFPAWLEKEVRERDKACVYCGVAFSMDAPHANRASWEHIINDAKIVTRENIVLCCRGCNSSKGVHDLALWLKSPYCKRRGITAQTVADVIKAALLRASYVKNSN
jgi:hypothetical protein